MKSQKNGRPRKSSCKVIPFPSPADRLKRAEALIPDMSQELADYAARHIIAVARPGTDINEAAKRLLNGAIDRLEQDQIEGGPWVA